MALAQLRELFPRVSGDVLRAALSAHNDVDQAAEYLLLEELSEIPESGDPSVGTVGGAASGGQMNSGGGAAASSSTMLWDGEDAAAPNGPQSHGLPAETWPRVDGPEEHCSRCGAMFLAGDSCPYGCGAEGDGVVRRESQLAQSWAAGPAGQGRSEISSDIALARRLQDEEERALKRRKIEGESITESDAALARQLQEQESGKQYAPNKFVAKNAGAVIVLDDESDEDARIAAAMQEEEERDALLAAMERHPDTVKAEFMPYNVIVFRRMADETEQRELLRDAFEKLQVQQTPVGGLGAKAGPTKCLVYNKEAATAARGAAGNIIGGIVSNSGTEPCCIELARNQYAKFGVQYRHAVLAGNEEWCGKTSGEGRVPQGGQPCPGWEYRGGPPVAYHLRADDTLTQQAPPTVLCPNPAPDALRLPLLGGPTLNQQHFEAKALWAFLYTPQMALSFHQDNPPHSGWVFLINLGAAVRFALYHPHYPGRLVRCELASGDGLFFNGEVLFHGVESIEAQGIPSWWGEVVAELGIGRDVARVGLQMRVAGHV